MTHHPRPLLGLPLAGLLLLGGWLQAPAVTLDVTAAPYAAACDGITDDAQAVQAALDALPATGGTVTVPAGRLCGLGAGGVRVQQRRAVLLEGLGPGAGLRALAPGAAFGGYGPTLVRLLNCTDCAVRHLTFDGQGQATNLLGIGASARVQVVANTFVHADYNGALVAYGNTDTVYAGNTADGLLGTTRAFWIGNANRGEAETRATIADNTLTALAGTAIALLGSGAVLRNTLEGTGNTHGAGIALACTATVRAQDVLVEGNAITGFAYHGLQSDCTHDGESTRTITVRGNTIRGTPGTGIYVVRARQWIVQDNVIEDVGLHGIYVQNARRITLTGNQITDTRAGAVRTTRDGIRVVGAANVLDVVTVLMDTNTVTHVTGHGIQVTNVAPGTMTDLRLQHNVLLENDGYGIFVADVTDGDITRVVATQNVVEGNLAGTIRMDPSDGVIE
jgi:parallel beta-helix repeat protein